MQRQFVVGLDRVSGIHFTCPRCEKEIFMSRKMLVQFYETGGTSCCPVCQVNKEGREIMEAMYFEHFRSMMDVVCGLSDFRNLKVRLIIPEE